MIKTILATLAVVFLIESLVILLFNKQVKKMLKQATKGKILRQVGFWELILAIFLLVLSLTLG